MDKIKILKFKNFKQFYDWLSKNHNKESFCWINANRGKPNNKQITYIDAVYAALCFGWIDSVFKKINGVSCQKFTPRSKKTVGHWSELNKERCRWLIKHKYMTKSGYDTLPDLKKKFVIDKDLLTILKRDKILYKNFKSFPELYQRIRAYNVAFYKFDKKLYKAALDNFIKNTKANKMYGQWNDNGKLLTK